jgi:hypothetical protein
VTADLSESYLIFECLQWSVQVPSISHTNSKKIFLLIWTKM